VFIILLQRLNENAFNSLIKMAIQTPSRELCVVIRYV